MIENSVFPVRSCGEESPSHGLAVPAPFRQGGHGDGRTDCHSQCAHWLRNDGSRKNLRVIPRPVRRLVVGIRNTPVQIQRGTDCHTSDIGHWFAMTVFCEKCGGAGRCGERTERCRWQRKRSERVAAVKILSVRRKAAQKFWVPQQDHRPLRIVYR